MTRGARPTDDHRPGADAGFSVVEVLVALALLAAMMALLPAAVRMATITWQTGLEIEQTSAFDLSLRTVLEQRMARALAVYDRQPDGRIGVAFRGDPGAVAFVAEAESGPSGAGVYHHAVGPGLAAGAVELRLRLYAPGAGPANEQPPPAIALARKPTGFRFRYFGTVSGETRPAWHAAWQGQPALPRLVEAVIVVGDGDGALERRIVVALRIDPAA